MEDDDDVRSFNKYIASVWFPLCFCVAKSWVRWWWWCVSSVRSNTLWCASIFRLHKFSFGNYVNNNISFSAYVTQQTVNECVCVCDHSLLFFSIWRPNRCCAFNNNHIVKITVRSFSSVRTSQYRCLYVSDGNPFQKTYFTHLCQIIHPSSSLPLSVNTVFRMVQLYCRCICTKFSYMYKTLVRSYYILFNFQTKTL